jgi:hypothetical protein
MPTGAEGSNLTTADGEGSWIALRSLSSGAHSRDPLARIDAERPVKIPRLYPAAAATDLAATPAPPFTTLR